MILEGEVNFPVCISLPLPSPGMDEALFCMTLAAVQQGCCAGWGTCTAGQPQPAQCLILLFWGCSPAAPAPATEHWQCLPSACPVLAQPQHPWLSPCLCIHVSFQRDSWNTAGLDATHPYSRDTAVARGGWFILWISPTLDFVLQYVFSEVLQLWWQHSTDLIFC